MSEYSTSSPEERPGVEQVDRPRSSDEIRVENEERRDELGATVEELARRVDVPARAKAWRHETLAQARTRGEQALSKLAKRTVVVRRWIEREPGQAALSGAGLMLFVLLVARRKRR